MKRILIISVIVVTAAAGYFLTHRGSGAVVYKELKLRRGPIAVEFRETGSVNPRNRLEIKPPIGGRIEDVLVVEGQKVKKGEVMAWMSSTDRAAMLDAAHSKGADEVKRWEDIYKPTPIIAPLDGFIIDRSKEPGQAISPSDIVVVMADKLIVQANVDETDLRHIRLGQKVEFFLDAYPDMKLEGAVEHIAYESQVINNVTVYTVKIRPDRVPENFRAGMTATIEVKADSKDNALLLPFDAVTDKNGVKTVLVKSDTEKPEVRTIETGASNGKVVEVVSGLSDDDIVLIARGGKRDRKASQTRMMGGIPGMGGGRH
jgi:macrolide-specific efflux system membrane fusion protein